MSAERGAWSAEPGKGQGATAIARRHEVTKSRSHPTTIDSNRLESTGVD